MIWFFRGFIKTTVDQEQYFSAPDNYTKQGRFAYTYSMSFKLQQDNVTSPENSTKGDVILNGTGFHQPIVYKLSSPPPTLFKTYTVRLLTNNLHEEVDAAIYDHLFICFTFLLYKFLLIFRAFKNLKVWDTVNLEVVFFQMKRHY